MRLYTYIVVNDTGFAPNPFHGYLTLACCKPSIRRTAEPGDLVVGLTPRSLGNRIVYVSRVEEKMTFDSYWSDPRFRVKRPDRTSRAPVLRKCGDNAYEAVGDRRYRQHPSQHSNGELENEKTKRRDLGGKYVLVSRDFVYFGKAALPLPEGFSDLVAGRGHKCRFAGDLIAKFETFRRTLGTGVKGPPRVWPENDLPWKAAR